MGTAIKSFLLFFLLVIFFLAASCGKAHDKIYGKQSLVVINQTDEGISVYRQDKRSEDWQIIGSIEKHKAVQYELSGIDCNYRFKALGGSKAWYSTLDVCGGAEWTIIP